MSVDVVKYAQSNFRPISLAGILVRFDLVPLCEMYIAMCAHISSLGSHAALSEILAEQLSPGHSRLAAQHAAALQVETYLYHSLVH